MANLKVNTVSGIGTEGTVFDGGLKFRSKNYLTLPKGTTTERTATSSGISTETGSIDITQILTRWSVILVISG